MATEFSYHVASEHGIYMLFNLNVVLALQKHHYSLVIDSGNRDLLFNIVFVFE